MMIPSDVRTKYEPSKSHPGQMHLQPKESPLRIDEACVYGGSISSLMASPWQRPCGFVLCRVVNGTWPSIAYMAINGKPSILSKNGFMKSRALHRTVVAYALVFSEEISGIKIFHRPKYQNNAVDPRNVTILEIDTKPNFFGWYITTGDPHTSGPQKRKLYLTFYNGYAVCTFSGAYTVHICNRFGCDQVNFTMAKAPDGVCLRHQNLSDWSHVFTIVDYYTFIDDRIQERKAPGSHETGTTRKALAISTKMMVTFLILICVTPMPAVLFFVRWRRRKRLQEGYNEGLNGREMLEQPSALDRLHNQTEQMSLSHGTNTRPYDHRDVVWSYSGQSNSFCNSMLARWLGSFKSSTGVNVLDSSALIVHQNCMRKTIVGTLPAGTTRAGCKVTGVYFRQLFTLKLANFLNEIGSGEFGRVSLGFFSPHISQTPPLGERNNACYANWPPDIKLEGPLALKQPKYVSAGKLAELRAEAITLAKVRHPNIVAFHGVAVVGFTPALVFEYMDHADLVNFLREHNSELTREARENTLSLSELLKIALQVSSAVEHLARCNIVHRDIAARNCLVGENLTVKLSDFGMSRALCLSDYYKIDQTSMVPLRWLPPETIIYRKFTSESDVWSFGVLLWEIFSFGEVPWAAYANTEVVDIVRSGRVLNRPNSCPVDIYEKLLLPCWDMLPQSRLKAASAKLKIQEFLSNGCRTYINIAQPDYHQERRNLLCDFSAEENSQPT